jgi:hypothetical protein
MTNSLTYETAVMDDARGLTGTWKEIRDNGKTVGRIYEQSDGGDDISIRDFEYVQNLHNGLLCSVKLIKRILNSEDPKAETDTVIEELCRPVLDDRDRQHGVLTPRHVEWLLAEYHKWT